MRSLVILAVVALMPVGLAAQETTTDGVLALITGDYQRAETILRPLADKPEGDPVAQFFLGTMYESGHGVPGNSLSACGWYQRAAGSSGPFAVQARRLLSATKYSLPPSRLLFCSTDDWFTGAKGLLPTNRGGIGRFEPGRLDGLRTPTTEGVEAFLRADYATAAELLRPIAERVTLDDGIASFFMGMLYDVGNGVAPDPARACAHYLGGTQSGNPFSMSDLTLLEANRATLTKAQADECSLMARVGFDHRFKPQMFTLEPGDSISVDIRGVTISRQGKDTRVNLDFGTRGVKFLSIEHLDLVARPARATHRHFIEMFRVNPQNQRESRWLLHWDLYEVIGTELVTIAREPLTEIHGSEPPSSLTPEMRDLVRLNVTPAGDVEVAIGGDHPHGGVIDSEEERLQAQRSSTAKRLAKTIDYARPLNPYRVPSFEYAEATSCVNLFVQGWSPDRAEALSLRANGRQLELSGTEQTFDLARYEHDISLVIHVYARSIRDSPFCSLKIAGVPDETWTAIRGSVSIALSPPVQRLNGLKACPEATVHIERAEFASNRTGGKRKLAHPITLKARVGPIAHSWSGSGC